MSLGTIFKNRNVVIHQNKWRVVDFRVQAVTEAADPPLENHCGGSQLHHRLHEKMWGGVIEWKTLIICHQSVQFLHCCSSVTDGRKLRSLLRLLAAPCKECNSVCVCMCVCVKRATADKIVCLVQSWCQRYHELKAERKNNQIPTEMTLPGIFNSASESFESKALIISSLSNLLISGIDN